jgi:hypothetical protein
MDETGWLGGWEADGLGLAVLAGWLVLGPFD